MRLLQSGEEVALWCVYLFVLYVFLHFSTSNLFWDSQELLDQLPVVVNDKFAALFPGRQRPSGLDVSLNIYITEIIPSFSMLCILLVCSLFNILLTSRNIYISNLLFSI
jgi:hypothetical protein